MEPLKILCFSLPVVILIFCAWCRTETGTEKEPVCYSRFDYDYKVMQKLTALESKQLALQDIIDSQSSLIKTLESKLQDSLLSQWGSWSSWSDCFMDCSGNNSGRIQTRSRSMSGPSEDLPAETESRPCNAVQFSGCVKDYGPKDNYGITYDSADQVALATCTAMSGQASHIYAVRRECSSQVVSCAAICKTAGQSPVLKRDQTGQQGLYMYRYNSCEGSFCGPNFCCCRKGS